MAVEILPVTDIISDNVPDALKRFIRPNRLVATLRSRKHEQVMFNVGLYAGISKLDGDSKCVIFYRVYVL